MVTEWPPKRGDLWLTAESWPAGGDGPAIPGGAWVLVLGGAPGRDGWWGGEVLGPNGRRQIKALQEDLIPGDDPRLVAPEFTRAA